MEANGWWTDPTELHDKPQPGGRLVRKWKTRPQAGTADQKQKKAYKEITYKKPSLDFLNVHSLI